MKKILVIGASGFVGRAVVQALLADGVEVRGLARNPAWVQDLATAGCEIVQGDISDLVSMEHGNGKQKMRNIAVGDLVNYPLGVLNDPRAYGQCFDVGCDDILTNDQMIDTAAEVVGRRHPIKIHVPQALLGAIAPLIERLSKFPRGSIKGLLDGLSIDLTGDPLPIRAIVPRPPLSYLVRL